MRDDFEKAYQHLERVKIPGLSAKSDPDKRTNHHIIEFGNTVIDYDAGGDGDNYDFHITYNNQKIENQEQCLQILQEIMPELRKKCGIVSVEEVTAGILSQLRFLGNDN